MSQRIFYFTNLNFITRKECTEIYDNSKKVQVNKKYCKNIEFQNYYKIKTRGNIESLNKLIETFIKDKDFNGIYKFEETIISTLYNYMIIKNKIPYNSFWFEEKYKQKSMLKMSDIELITYVNILDSIYFDLDHDNNKMINEWFNFILNMYDEQLFMNESMINDMDDVMQRIIKVKERLESNPTDNLHKMRVR